MPINASHEYFSAEKEYLNAKSLEDKIFYLEEMIKTAPKHKGSENLLMELRIRLKKFKGKAEKAKKKSGGKRGIRKDGFQFVMMGKTNKGKSSLLKLLTNARPLIGEYEFTTREPGVGTFQFEGVQAQVIDVPSVGCEQYDSGLVNSADCLLIVLEDLKELKELEEFFRRTRGKKVVIVNKVDKLNGAERRKLMARMKSKRIDGEIISAKTGERIDELKGRMLELTGAIRIYLKEPGKPENRKRPLVLKHGATIKDVAEHILKGYSRSVKETRITGPSSKFTNQRVGLTHKVRDKDVVEFHTR